MGQQLLLDFDQELEEGIPVEDSYGQNSSRDLSQSVTAATAAVQDGGSYVAPQHPNDKIVDVGEVIWGARKDMVLYLTRMNAEITFEALVKKPLSQLFKRLDLRKAVDQGTLREKDARFYETLLTFIDSHKPRMSQSDVRRKERWSSYESPVDKWAKTTLEDIRAVNAFVMAPEAERDAIIEKELGNRFLDNGEGNHLPNPLWVVWEALDRLDYRSGDKVDIPFPVVKWQSYLDSFTLTDLKEDKSHGHYSSVESAIDSMSYITRIKAGDVEQEHPLAFFSISPTRAEYGDTGQFAVVWGGFYNSRREVFDNRETAESFAEKKKDPHIIPLQKIVNRTDYVIDFVHPVSGDKYRVSDRTFATRDDAEDFLHGNYNVLNDAVNLRLSKELEKKGERRQLRPEDVVYAASTYGKDGWRYSVMIDKKYANNFDQPLILKDFYSREDAERFLKENRDIIFNIVKGYLADKKKVVFFDTGKNSRLGEDYRHGRDVGAEDFMNEFGFRGVQFGNWTNQDDRQMAVNQAYDSFHDLAKLLGVSPKALSLNGELGIAFGARGSGNAAAHYEPGEVVINLTKMNGAGALAHEWWHALDNYFARQAGVRIGHVTEYRSIPMRDSLRRAFDVLVDKVKASDYYGRSVRCGKYWGDIKEVTARLFAEWVDQELKARGERNTFLSSGINPEFMQRLNYQKYGRLTRIAGEEPMSFDEYRETKESLVGIPYPTVKEVQELGFSVRNIFDIVEERADRDNGRVAMFHRVSEGLPEGVSSLEFLVTDKERGLRDGLVDIMRSAGIEVSTDWELGQRVLNDYLDKKNDNTDYLTLVFSKKGRKNNESPTEKGEASELGPPTPKDAALANVGTKIVNKSECVKRLSELFDYIDQKKTLGPHELLHEIVISFDSSLKKEQASFVSTDSSKYFNFENGSTLRVSDHKGNVELFDLRNNYYNNYGLVIKLSPSRFIGNDEVDYLEYVYYPDKLKDNARQKAIVAGLREFVETGDFTRLPSPDKIWISGKGETIGQSKDIKMFRTEDGEAYGFTLGGRIYLDPRIATAETPIHEYSHLWAEALRRTDPKSWKHVVKLMRGTPIWNDIKSLYSALCTDDEIADEVLAHYSGRRGAERLRVAQDKALGSADDPQKRTDINRVFDSVREALRRFWTAVAGLLHVRYGNADDVADTVLSDLLHGRNPLDKVPSMEKGADFPVLKFHRNGHDSNDIEDKSPTTEKSHNPLNDTINMEEKQSKVETGVKSTAESPNVASKRPENGSVAKTTQKKTGVERHAEILIAALERMPEVPHETNRTLVNEQQKPRPQIYGKEHGLGPINSLVLALRSDELGNRTNVFMTFKDIKDRGEAVRRGQSSTPIVFTNRNEFVARENPDERIKAEDYWALSSDERKNYAPRVDVHNVFNIDQTTMSKVSKGEYEYIVSENAAVNRQDSYLSKTDTALRKEVNDFIKKMKDNLVPIHSDRDKTGVAAYYGNRDVIVQPAQNKFETYNDYVEAVTRNVVEATSIPARLNRNDTDRDRELLVQDLSTAAKMLDFGLPGRLRPETMVALPELVKRMKEEPRFAQGIIRDVNRIVGMINKAENGEKIELRYQDGPKDFKAVVMVKDDNKEWTLAMKPENGPTVTVHPTQDDISRYFDLMKTDKNDPRFEQFRTQLGQKYYSLFINGKAPAVNIFESKATKEELALVSGVNAFKSQRGESKMLLTAFIGGKKQPAVEMTQEQWNRMWLADDKQSYKTHLAATLYADVIARQLGKDPKAAVAQAEDQAKHMDQQQAAQADFARKTDEEKRRNSPEQKEKERREEKAREELTKAETKAVAAIALAPLMRQFLNLKEKQPDALVLMRVDDRYETYQEDARKIAGITNLPLKSSSTSKGPDGKDAVFVAFPSDKLEHYLTMLVGAKQTVALADNIDKQHADEQRSEPGRNDGPARDVAMEQADEQRRGGGMHR